MADISFDDLIPKKPAPAGGDLNFDDLIPAKREAAIAEKAVADYRAPEDTVIPGLHVARAAQTVGDLARVGIGQGLGLGFGDEAMAAVQSLGGTPYEEALQQQQDANVAAKARLSAETYGAGNFMEAAPQLAYGGGKTLLQSALRGYGLGTASSVGHGETDPLKVLGSGAVGAVAGGTGSVAGNIPNIARAAAGPVGYGLGVVSKKPLEWMGLAGGAGAGPVTAGLGYLKGLAIKKAAGAAGGALDTYSVSPRVDTDAARDLYARMLMLGGRQATDR